MSDRKLSMLIEREIACREAEHQIFCKISYGFPLSDLPTSLLLHSPAVDRLGFYTLGTSFYMDRKGNDNCSILRIDSMQRVKDNVAYDLRLDQERLGEDFCRRRAVERGNVYVNGGDLDGYICYHGSAPVGTCELFLHNDVAKIDNFTVLPCEQRKGYGTSLLKHLICSALEKGAKTVYLVTNEDDTAKEMYLKFGFEKTDESTELLFML